MKKRAGVIILCFMLLLSLLPATAFASEEIATGEEISGQVSSAEPTVITEETSEMNEPAAEENRDSEQPSKEDESPEIHDPAAEENWDNKQPSEEEASPKINEPATEENRDSEQPSGEEETSEQEVFDVISDSSSSSAEKTNEAASSDFNLSEDGKTLIEYIGTPSDGVVTVPNGIVEIGSTAFYGNSNIQKLVLPDSLKIIHNQAFRFCDNMTEVVFPSGLETIEYSAFEGCRSLKAVELPDSVTFLDDYAFSSCDLLEHIKLPAGLEQIGANSFQYDPRLKAVNIPASVLSIGKGSFIECHPEMTLVSAPGSAAQQYAMSANLNFASTGVNVSCSVTASDNASCQVLRNGQPISGQTTVLTGDVLKINASTTAEALDITVNGKTLLYEFSLSKQNQISDLRYIITGPVAIEAKGINAEETLEASLNDKGGQLSYSGTNVFPAVDGGRSVIYFGRGNASVSTTVNLDKTGYLQFDIKNFYSSSFFLYVDDTRYDLSAYTWNYNSYVQEIPAGQHTIQWSRFDQNETSADNISCAIDQVMITTNIQDIFASAFSVPVNRIDLDINESLKLDYIVLPELLKGKKKVDWSSSNESVVTVSADTVTAHAHGIAVVTGTIDGIQSNVTIYVSSSQYGEEPPELPYLPAEGTPVTEEAVITCDPNSFNATDDLLENGRELHLTNDPATYFYNGRKLYRLNITAKNAEPETLYEADGSIQAMKSRGSVIYLETQDSSYYARFIGYDVRKKDVVFDLSLPYYTWDLYGFAVDDAQNLYVSVYGKDLISYDKNGNKLSEDIQSTAKLISGLGSLYIDQVDPFNYSLLVHYTRTMGRSLHYYEDYSFTDFSDAFSYSGAQRNYSGFRLIRNGKIIDPVNYIKNPTAALEGGSWNLLDNTKYAVTSSGRIIQLSKTKQYNTGVDYTILYTVSNARRSGGTIPAVLCGDSIYVANSQNIVYQYDTKMEKVLGIYEFSSGEVQNLYASDGKVYVRYSRDTKSYIAPLENTAFTETHLVERKDHVTLQYTKDDIVNHFKASLRKLSYYDTNQVYERVPQITAPYDAGKLSDNAKEETLNRLNYFRWQYGITPVSIMEQYMERNQKGAVVLAATNKLTHYPTKPSDMDEDFFKEAEAGVGAAYEYSGNISFGDSVYDAIKGYIDDVSNMNGGIGHRLSLLDYTADRTSFGSAGSYSCLSMYYAEDTLPNDEEFYAWPSAGYFPIEAIDTNADWHIITSFSTAENMKVVFTYNGKEYTQSELSYDKSYYAFYFSLPQDLKDVITSGYRFKEGAEVTVRFSGLKDQYDNPVEVVYPVRFISGEGDRPWIKGDVNGDKTVDSADLAALAKHVAKITTITDTNLLNAADVNSDGAVDAKDLTLLAKYVAHIISEL